MSFANAPSNINAVMPDQIVGANNQPNHPFETKYRLLMNILQKITNFRKLSDPYLLENLLGIII